MPELLGKWFTWERTALVPEFDKTMNDEGMWCYCQQVKGGSCENKQVVSHGMVDDNRTTKRKMVISRLSLWKENEKKMKRNTKA